ncbi:HMCT-like protein [Mya arenaria]|uniref:HMCT-like protein n=1 Tax=Mya arenaria TaxID=6604 RepID=A0ABY7G739_MYAAR|nr:HMCT-like protein [Mya arenaria]
MKGQKVSTFTSSIPAVSLIKCESMCSLRKRNGMCNICGYDKTSKTCFLSDDNEDDIILTSDDRKVVLKPVEKYLVNGGDPVSDAQFSASSVYVNASNHAASGARLHSLPSPTSIGAWGAWTLDANQYIQVQLNGLSQVVGVAVQGRPINADGCCNQHVTSYKVLYSWNCQQFLTVNDTSGMAMTFAGNTDQDTVVTSMLPKQVSALCVRINPVTWMNRSVLRFDILGCRV